MGFIFPQVVVQDPSIAKLLKQGEVLASLAATPSAATEATGSTVLGNFWLQYFLAFGLFLVAAFIIGFVILKLTKKSEYLPHLSALFFLVGISSAVYYTSWLSQQKTRLVSIAAPEKMPRNIRLSEVNHDGFVLEWQTEKPVFGTIKLTLDEGKSEKAFIDETGASELNKHRVKAFGLEPQTTYFVEIISGGEVYNHNGKPLMVRTD